MATISDKLTYLAETKEQIKQAIIDKGGEVADTDTFRSYAEKIENLDVSGSGESGDYLFQVIDYDGTVLATSRHNEGDTATLPSDPSHEGLVFDGWSSPVTITDGTIIMPNSDVTIGPMYSTESGNTEIDIELTKVTGLDVTINSSGTIDWGDGTSDTGSTDGVTHIYENYGEYTISIGGATSLSGGTTVGSNITYSEEQLSFASYTIKNVRIGSSVTSIGSYTFNSCNSLKSVTVPSSVDSIEYAAFGGCRLLTSVTIPDSVTSIEANVFQNCYSLTSAAIPDSVTSIGNYAFYCCSSLTSVTISSGVTSIGNYAFYKCASITNKSITIPSSVTSVGDYAFYDWSFLTNVTISSGVTSIGGYAFYGCSSLTNVNMPSSVTSIGNQAFRSCDSLTNVVIPNSVTSIGEHTFRSCESLKSVTISSGVASVGEYVFYGCRSLTSVLIPSSVGSIGYSAFGDCYSVLTYDFSQLTAVPTLSSTGIFSGINALAKIIVPDDLYDEWIEATNWTTYADYIYKASEVEG